MSSPKPFTIAVSDEKLDWITQRVATAHIIPDIEHPAGKEWEDGVPPAIAKELVDFWRDSYDWRKVEARLNATFKMFTVDIDDLDVHFVHHKSTRQDAIPLIFVHGWPGNFLEVEGLLECLVEPVDPTAQAFHIVAPSLPGFAFSSEPSTPLFKLSEIAALFDKLMVSVLGYTSYVAEGGDLGAGVVRCLAANHPGCLAVHSNSSMAFDAPSPFKYPLAFLKLITSWYTPNEKTRFGRMVSWFTDHGAYAKLQGEKPQTVSYALMDSPVGLLTWIYDKTSRMVDPTFVWPYETVITWTMIYLLAGSAGHARIYKTMNVKGDLKLVGPSKPFGFSLFAHDVGYAPRWWAQGAVAENIVMWKEYEHGGHFPTLECADVFAKDIQEFASVSIPRKSVQKLQDAGK
ncbi:alpha beta-hydrolase [Cylindrobasidium torrendii FP15055 ss-10]|uniref:Alpha beta-hydrolase n=1 Tax=Cylindrobasidium torrendii FP15055 ss-10 TaxID=1314674 RepID=A0A0D7ATD6_9AGAR|nr:alpha beta-hydrolase [Cylindrobasidium torrendii FP15055 ss-10]